MKKSNTIFRLWEIFKEKPQKAILLAKFRGYKHVVQQMQIRNDSK